MIESQDSCGSERNPCNRLQYYHSSNRSGLLSHSFHQFCVNSSTLTASLHGPCSSDTLAMRDAPKGSPLWMKIATCELGSLCRAAIRLCLAWVMIWCLFHPMFQQQSALNRAVIHTSLDGNSTQHLARMLFALKLARDRSSLSLPRRHTQLYMCIPKNQKHYLFYLRIRSLTVALLNYGRSASRGEIPCTCKSWRKSGSSGSWPCKLAGCFQSRETRTHQSTAIIRRGGQQKRTVELVVLVPVLARIDRGTDGEATGRVVGALPQR